MFVRLFRITTRVTPRRSTSKRVDCITDNPAFKAVCLNPWVLQAAWYSYKQQYGTKAIEGPEDKQNRHVAYRHLARWCWGYLGKEIRVPLPACAVSCIRTHFLPSRLEENFVFKGFHFADELSIHRFIHRYI